MRVAVVDLGTNTCRLLLAEVVDGRIAAMERRDTTVVRLGEGVDRHGRLAPAAVARTASCLATYAALMEAYRPCRRVLVATSVVRDAPDGHGFLERVRREHGLPWRVLDGREEAALAFAGATAGLGDAAEVAVVDIGGGSTEFAVGRPGAGPRFVVSVDVGAVRVTERCFTDDPPDETQWRAAEALVAGALAAGVPPAARAGGQRFIGVAGTFTTLSAFHQGLRTYRRERVHGSVLTLADVQSAIARFRLLTSAERGVLPGIQKGREDVILAGALIAREACRLLGASVVQVSEADIIEGVALWLAAAPEAALPRV